MTEKNQAGQKPVDQHILHLVNSSIDGEISHKEQEELERLLMASPEVRNLNDELRTITRLLDEVTEVEPPEHLQDSIERQVRLPSQVHTDPKSFWGIDWLGGSWLRTGFALAAGAVLTIGVYEMGSEPITARDSTSIVGTMASNGSADQPGALLDSIQLNSVNLNGHVELHGNEELFTLELQLNTDELTDVVIDFAGRGLYFDGVNGRQSRDDSVSIEDGSIHLAGSGELQYTVKLRRASSTQQLAPLDVSFFSGDDLILQTELKLTTN